LAGERQNRTASQGQTEANKVFEKLPQPNQSNISHTIAVMSGKGGVGKSSLTALLAASLARCGHRVGVLDADVTGPSIPRLLGVKERPLSLPHGIVPPRSPGGIEVMSLNLFLEHEDDPVIWRGPIIAGVIRQFWSDVIWGNLDYLVVDLPPGTGDAPLTVLQSLPVDGLVIVSSPQDLAVMVVKKAIKMAQMLNVPILGLVENMSGMRCPKCGETIDVFGPSRARTVSQSTGVRLLGVLPLDGELASLSDAGEIEKYRVDFLEAIPSLMDGIGHVS